jgi:pimeloyl-ACP methyl ester carboxylesterase
VLARWLGIVSTGQVVSFWGRGSVWRSFVAEQRALVDELPVVTERLRSIAAPTTILVGGRDRVVRPKSAWELAALIPEARVIEVPKAGHLLSQEAPAVIAAAVRESAVDIETRPVV